MRFSKLEDHFPSIAYLEVLQYDVGVQGAGGGAGGGGGRGGRLLVYQHPHRVADPPPVTVLCSAPSVPQPVVQSRRRPLLGPSPG